MLSQYHFHIRFNKLFSPLDQSRPQDSLLAKTCVTSFCQSTWKLSWACKTEIVSASLCVAFLMQSYPEVKKWYESLVLSMENEIEITDCGIPLLSADSMTWKVLVPEYAILLYKPFFWWHVSLPAEKWKEWRKKKTWKCTGAKDMLYVSTLRFTCKGSLSETQALTRCPRGNSSSESGFVSDLWDATDTSCDEEHFGVSLVQLSSFWKTNLHQNMDSPTITAA